MRRKVLREKKNIVRMRAGTEPLLRHERHALHVEEESTALRRLSVQ